MPPWPFSLRIHYYENLAWACYVGPRYDDALSAMSRYKADFPALYAAICVRLGRLDEARRAIADALEAGTKVSIAKEGSMPQIEPQRVAYLNDLRAAGVTGELIVEARFESRRCRQGRSDAPIPRS